jgi:glycine hydroxymethyltransferase
MRPSLISAHLQKHARAISDIDSGLLAFLANLENVAQVSPVIAGAILQELIDQRSNIKLIASENYSSLSTQSAMANPLTDKYAEGYAHHRFYAGCDNVDTIEQYAVNEARALFGAEHAYVQPHSGADANLVAFWAVLTARIETPALEELGIKDSAELNDEQWNSIRQRLGNQRLLGMDLRSGGHLTHGYRKNASAKMFQAFSYAVNPETSLLDYDEVARRAAEVKPLILLAGYSAYPRTISFRRMREIADNVGAVFMVDMAHFAGLVAGKVFEGDSNPVAHAHIVTSTTHKTLRGPRGGIVLCTSEFADAVDKGCPLVLGGPLPHVIAAKAVAFTEARRPEFRDYARRIVENARALAEAFLELGQTVVSNGTDNHLVLLDVRPFGLTGRQAESAVRETGITLNRNTIPFDPNGPWYTSGLRIGTPAVTTLGMTPSDMKEIASIMTEVLRNTTAEQAASGPSKAKYRLAENARKEARARVDALLSRYRVYPELDTDLIADFLTRLGPSPRESADIGAALRV